MVVRLAGGWWVRQAGCWRGERPRCRPFGARRSPETALSALFPPLVWGCRLGGGWLTALVVNEDDLLAGQGLQYYRDRSSRDLRRCRQRRPIYGPVTSQPRYAEIDQAL